MSVDQQLKEDEINHTDKKEVPLEDTFKKIFLTNYDFNMLPRWNLFFMGHGLPGKTIVDLSLDSFKKILNFCAYSITTDYFMYLSCFAGGVNKINAFTQEENNSLRVSTYPYTIIAFSSAEQTVTHRFNAADCAPRFLTLFKALEQKKEPLDFFAMAKDARMLGYCTTKSAYALGSVTRVYDPQERAYITQGVSLHKTAMLPKNIPQVRLPGREFFSVEPVFGTKKNPDIMLISNVISKTFPLDKVMRVPATTQGIFLNTHIIPQDIELMSPTVYIPQFVPLELKSSYFFSSISATHLSVYEFLRMFGLFPPNVRITIGNLLLKNSDLKNPELSTLLNYPHDATLFFSDVSITILPINEDTIKITLMADVASQSLPNILEASLRLSYGSEQRGCAETTINACTGTSTTACIERRVKDLMHQNYRVFDQEVSERGKARTTYVDLL